MPGRPESKEFIALKNDDNQIHEIALQILKRQVTRQELTEQFHVNYGKLQSLLLRNTQRPLCLKFKKGRKKIKVSKDIAEILESAHDDGFGYKSAAQIATEEGDEYCSAAMAYKIYKLNGWLKPKGKEKREHKGKIYIGVAGELFHTDITFFSRKKFKHLYENPALKAQLEAARQEKGENAEVQLGLMAFIDAGSRLVLGYCWLFRKTSKETTRALKLFIEGSTNDDDVVQGLPGWTVSRNAAFKKKQLKPYGIVTDNGKEYLNGEFDAYLLDHGIKHLVIDKMQKEHNGKIERFWRFCKQVLLSPKANFARAMKRKNTIVKHYAIKIIPMDAWKDMKHYQQGDPLSECNRYQTAPFYLILEQKRQQFIQQEDPNSATYNNRYRQMWLQSQYLFRLEHPEQFENDDNDEWLERMLQDNPLFSSSDEDEEYEDEDEEES